MRLIINLCLPFTPSIITGFRGGGGGGGRREGWRGEWRMPISPSPFSRHEEKQPPAPALNSQPALLWGLQESGRATLCEPRKAGQLARAAHSGVSLSAAVFSYSC